MFTARLSPRSALLSAPPVALLTFGLSVASCGGEVASLEAPQVERSASALVVAPEPAKATANRGLARIIDRYGIAGRAVEPDGGWYTDDLRTRRVLTTSSTAQPGPVWLCEGQECRPIDVAEYTCTSLPAPQCYCQGLVDCIDLYFSGKCSDGWGSAPGVQALFCGCHDPNCIAEPDGP